jgi:hypothetical protein
MTLIEDFFLYHAGEIGDEVQEALKLDDGGKLMQIRFVGTSLLK